MLDRRRFLSYIPAAATTFVTFGGLAQRGFAAPAQSHQGVGAIETLMRGHGLLLRSLIVYDVSRERISKGQLVDPGPILKTAEVIRNYLQGFHEFVEERYLFKPLEVKNVCFDSIQELKIQHGTGIALTQHIINLTKTRSVNAELALNLSKFILMYRHHAAWEDTVVFPAFDELKERKDLAEVAAELHSEEKKLLGQDGFDDFLKKIADAEKELGIYELSTSTPKA